MRLVDKMEEGKDIAQAANELTAEFHGGAGTSDGPMDDVNRPGPNKNAGRFSPFNATVDGSNSTLFIKDFDDPMSKATAAQNVSAGGEIDAKKIDDMGSVTGDAEPGREASTGSIPVTPSTDSKGSSLVGGDERADDDKTVEEPVVAGVRQWSGARSTDEDELSEVLGLPKDLNVGRVMEPMGLPARQIRKTEDSKGICAPGVVR
jgi:hypothetical protein